MRRPKPKWAPKPIPAGVVELARRRTRDLTRSLLWSRESFADLLASCYLLGPNDGIDATAPKTTTGGER